MTFLTPQADLPEFETLWVNVTWQSSQLTFVAVYHPPKPIYDISTFKNFLFQNIDDVTINGSSTLFMAGDFNQFPDDDLQQAGLQSLVTAPTRGQSCLDRIYTSSV